MKLDQAQFYRARADAERAMAEQTRLPHERVRHLRSAEVWDAMALKAEHSLGSRLGTNVPSADNRWKLRPRGHA